MREYCINAHMSSSGLPLNACRTCGATNYRRVIERDANGALRPTGLYHCSGCSVVFANPAAWRDGGVDVAATQAGPIASRRAAAGVAPGGSAAIAGDPCKRHPARPADIGLAPDPEA